MIFEKPALRGLEENRHDRPMFQLPARSDPDAGQYRTYHMAMRLRLWRGVSQRQEQKRRRGQLEYTATLAGMEPQQ